MSDVPTESESEESTEEEENASVDTSGSSNSEKRETMSDTAEYAGLFDGVEEVNNETAENIEHQNSAPQGQPGATALNELAQGESLTEVLTVALKEWREMQQISRQRDEAEYAFQRTVIRIGALAFGVVIIVSGILSFTGNLPGSSFAFILGTLFGSLATILQSFLRKQQPNE